MIFLSILFVVVISNKDHDENDVKHNNDSKPFFEYLPCVKYCEK